MKIKFSKETKKEISISKGIIESLSGHDLIDYVKVGVKIASGSLYVERVIEASAEISKNGRVWNALTDNSEDNDIWFDFTAITNDGIVIGGAYLTDIWNYNGENGEELRKHTFARIFREEVKKTFRSEV